MTDSTVDTVGKAIGAGSLGFGIFATLSPAMLRRTYGDSVSTGGSLDYFGRTWGTRTAVLGALSLMAETDSERKRIAGLSASMNFMDSVAALRSKGMPAVTRTMAALTSAGFGAAAVYYARNL
jgi:hypothetical protein